MQKKVRSVPEAESAPELTFEELAVRQGVGPVRDFDSLLGRPVPGDESAQDFQVTLREWRREGVEAEHRR